MAKVEPTRNGYHRLDGVLAPDGKSRTHAWVSITDLQRIYLHSRWKYHNLAAARVVLSDPDEVWRALRQVGEEELLGYAFVSRRVSLVSPDAPAQRYPLPEGKVFLAFLDLEMTVVEWRTEVLPEGGFVADGDRFRERLWSRS